MCSLGTCKTEVQSKTSFILTHPFLGIVLFNPFPWIQHYIFFICFCLLVFFPKIALGDAPKNSWIRVTVYSIPFWCRTSISEDVSNIMSLTSIIILVSLTFFESKIRVQATIRHQCTPWNPRTVWTMMPAYTHPDEFDFCHSYLEILTIFCFSVFFLFLQSLRIIVFFRCPIYFIFRLKIFFTFFLKIKIFVKSKIKS